MVDIQSATAEMALREKFTTECYTDLSVTNYSYATTRWPQTCYVSICVYVVRKYHLFTKLT